MLRVKGSITVFSLISLLLVTATIFALLEGTRLQELHRFASLQTESSLESVFANYNDILWKNYRILGTNYSQMEEILQKTSGGRTGEGANLLRLKPEGIETEEYTLITDGEGRIFIHSVSTYMQENFFYETIKELYNQYESIKEILGKSDFNLEYIENALEEIKKAESIDTQASYGSVATNKEVQIDVLQILETIQEWQEKGILKLVIKDTQQVSDSEIDLEDSLLQRERLVGTSAVYIENDWKDGLLFYQYLLTYLSHFGETVQERGLAYELEYLLGGKSKDVDNLKIVVTKILAIRSAVNFLFLITNPVKLARADSMATVFVGATLNPLVIEIVKTGMIAAWAFAESVADIRALLAGKKIPMLKSDDSWTVELENIGALFDGFLMAEECEWGLDYKSYLGILLFFENEQDSAMRTLNLQEVTIRKTNPEFRIDEMLVESKVQITYSYEPVFPFLEIFGMDEKWKYQILTKASYGYY